jgi:hypothetical protein
MSHRESEKARRTEIEVDAGAVQAIASLADDVNRVQRTTPVVGRDTEFIATPDSQACEVSVHLKDGRVDYTLQSISAVIDAVLNEHQSLKTDGQPPCYAFVIDTQSGLHESGKGYVTGWPFFSTADFAGQVAYVNTEQRGLTYLTEPALLRRTRLQCFQCKLPLTPQMQHLLRWAKAWFDDNASKALFEQDRMLELCKLDLKPCIDAGVVKLLEKLTVTNRSQLTADVEHGKRSMGQSIESAVASRTEQVRLPEEITLRVKPFANVAYVEPITARLHIEHEIGLRFGIFVHPDEFTTLLAGAAAYIHSQMIEYEADLEERRIYGGVAF